MRSAVGVPNSVRSALMDQGLLMVTHIRFSKPCYHSDILQLVGSFGSCDRRVYIMLTNINLLGSKKIEDDQEGAVISWDGTRRQPSNYERSY